LTYIFGLPFLDPLSAGDCFAYKLTDIQLINAKLRQFMVSLVENYIDSNSLFPPPIWTENSSSVDRENLFIQNFIPNFIHRTQILTFS